MSGQCELGMVGLGVMGRNLLLNMAEHGHLVAAYNKHPEKLAALRAEAPGIQTFDQYPEFVAALRSPRVVMLLVPAGSAVDSVIREISPLLAPGDVIIDGGNSFFKDTETRQRMLAEQGILFLGVGVSGGEEGARHGPCMMPGGPRAAWGRVRPVLESVAAHVDGEPCVSYMGLGSAGHFVKMVHNGIEYGAMQLIAEAYDLMKRGFGLDDDELGAVFEEWNESELHSFLVEITACILRKADPKTGQRLVDVIRDVALQKGTGAWTSRTALELHVPVPTLDTAVSMRDLSALKGQRITASGELPGPGAKFHGDKVVVLHQLRGALYAGFIVIFAQGFALLYAASDAYGYDLNLETIARIWRGGCIIRAALLDPIATAFHGQPELPNLLLNSEIAAELTRREAELRAIVSAAATHGIPASGFMSVLGYYDSYRSAWLPANLIEAQRDFFGAHGYERTDETGTFHTEWSHD